MEKQELLDRITKVELKISKIEKRIAKWTAGMNEEAKAIAASCEIVYGQPGYETSYNNYKNYANEHRNDPTVFNSEYWNRGPQLSEAYTAYRDLAEAKNTLHKYKVMLDKLTNFDNAEKIEVIWAFLQNWKDEIRQWIIDECEAYYQLQSNEKRAWDTYKNSDKYKQEYSRYKSYNYSDSQADYNVRRWFTKDYYASVPSLVYRFYTYRGGCDEKALDKWLNAEVRARYNDLVNRITEKCGEIVDASGLYIGRAGNINGIVDGTKGRVKVETISAEGPVQRFHYRTLVHLIRG